MDEKKIYPVNAIILGESSVGKSSIMNRLLDKGYDAKISPSIGINAMTYSFENKKKLPNSKIEIQYWDTLGQEVFRSLCTLPIKKADIIIFVRDNESDNLNTENGWINFVKDNLKIDLPEKKIIFCLNKTDLREEEEKKEIFEELSNISQDETLNGEVFLISAKNSDGIMTLQGAIKRFTTDLLLREIREHDEEVNICLFGQSNVGKTSLINRLIRDNFIESTIPTINLIKKEYNYVDLKNNTYIKYNYYDIPGHEKYMKEYSDILKKIHIIIFVNDKDNLEILFDIIDEKCNLVKKKCIFCINKVDLYSDGEKREIRRKYLNYIGVNDFLFVSAKNSHGIEELKQNINQLGVQVIKQRNNNNKDENEKSLRVRNDIITLNIEEVRQTNKTCKQKIKDCINSIIFW